MAGMSIALLATLAAALGAALGLLLTGLHRVARLVVGFSGGLLLGVALFGLLPEVVSEIGWGLAPALFTAGYALLMLVDRYVYPVCPSCSHDHDHDACDTTLHGFAAPLILATACHAFLDGWSIATSQWTGTDGLRVALPVALALHKVPEGIALGAILRASMRTRIGAFGLSLLTESATLAGAGCGLAVAPRLGARWLHYPLAIAGGCFFYLGFHAAHGEWRRRKSWIGFMPGVTGAASAALLQHGVVALFRR
jgi:zinc transporter ZupT